MIKRAVIAVAAVLAVGCGPSQTPENTVGGAGLVSSKEAPLTKGATSLSLDWGTKAQSGEVAIADVLSYGGSKPTITAPARWQLIRDDSTKTTRQSLYWHAAQANEPSTATWTFSEPVDAQGAIVLLDNVLTTAPVDMTSGNTGDGGTLTAKSIVTTSDADLLLSFYATDFHLDGLGPQLPADANTLINQEKAPNEFWILTAYQDRYGATEDLVCSAPQLFSWTAAQVAIRRGAATSPTP